MSRLARFGDYRYIGVRDTMTFYDCDDVVEFEKLAEMVDGEDLVGRKMLQSFAPDSPEEAANRGFKAA